MAYGPRRAGAGAHPAPGSGASELASLAGGRAGDPCLSVTVRLSPRETS